MDQNKQQDANKEEKGTSLLLYLHDFASWVIAIMLIFLLIFRISVVSGHSMDQTLQHGDYLLILNNVVYTEPKQGDILVFGKKSFKDGEPVIKRVIATEGQWVDIDFDAGVVYVNGNPLDEPYANTPTFIDEGVSFPLMVEEGCIFVLGDNRNSSKDSRSPDIGQVDKREILGKAFFIILPGTDEATGKKNFNRIGALL